MRIVICAIGRLRSGPEADLVSDYLSRASKAGRAHHMSGFEVLQAEAKKPGQAAEAETLRRLRPTPGITLCLDERGRQFSSPEFATMLAARRDEGHQNITFLIGGADGLAADLRQEADGAISFGKMVWPHMLARVMLAEQLYRAVNILSGTPYHRA